MSFVITQEQCHRGVTSKVKQNNTNLNKYFIFKMNIFNYNIQYLLIYNTYCKI